MTRHEPGDLGFSLVEMLLVVALLGVALTVVFNSVQMLANSAKVNMEESAAAHDLSYSMELLSKALMSGRIMYADDYRVMMLSRRADGSYEMNSIYAASGPDPAHGSLIWERWGSNSSGTARAGSSHTVWAMSDRNVNKLATPAVPLFTYYKDVTSSSLMAVADKSTSADLSMSAFTGSLPGGYTISAVRRIRLHILAAFITGTRDDTRDILLRVGT